MILTLSPRRSDETLTVERTGDVLTLNGDDLDLSVIPEGGLLPATAVGTPWIVGNIRRRSGTLSLTLVVPHGPDAPQETRFPTPITLTTDGPVALPPHAAPAAPEQATP